MVNQNELRAPTPRPPSDESGVGFAAGNQRLFTEDPEVVRMSRWRWETMIARFSVAKERAAFGDLWPWAGLIVAVLPPILADDFRMTLLGLSPDAWFGVFLIGLLLALLRMGLVMGEAFIALEWDRGKAEPNILFWGFPRPSNWVPRNVADFVELVVREIEAEQPSSDASHG